MAKSLVSCFFLTHGVVYINIRVCARVCDSDITNYYKHILQLATSYNGPTHGFILPF